ncbi:MAG: UDP-N-acetylmuramoyl-L-alanyl-D-glutamate--2,6-diaminopimelate ligase [Oscillospiraceae bacterium]|jgi:UDP-N-acetylmuramoyl-L-alanyl-D-glutamate--2,6-diaminopimelate ligase|nr:UDP-N-acetylmuramoyl-L-alanyl-D-glutamate--2,6-diaminopimelate ligase [Oscillospiraceae bacterium]
MKLGKILRGTEILYNSCSLKTEISDIVYDSRKIIKDCIFVCLNGFNSNGHEFAKKALEKGAKAILSEEKMNLLNLILVKNTRASLAVISANFFGHPAEKINTIAITGTKGKTTTAYLISGILNAAGQKTASIGTLGFIIGSEILKTENTTPESYEIQKFLKKSIDNGFKNIVIEASSIGLKSHRLDNINFDYAIFTNFSSDHIGKNEHENIEDYFKSKLILFGRSKFVFLNNDDKRTEFIMKKCSCSFKTFGFKEEADFCAKDFKLVSNSKMIGSEFVLNKIKFSVSIPGKFSVYNALAAICVCREMGVSEEKIKEAITGLHPKGRAEIISSQNGYSIIIDYAHNALSMKNILTALREYRPKRLVALFGAGGERSKERRFEVGKISGELSDLTIITEDNSRMESVFEIIKDIESGMLHTKGKYKVIPNRKEAIRWCIINAREGDVILLAGKGHEDYQEINGVKYHFDEREVVKEIMNF